VGLVVGDYRWWHPEASPRHYWPEGVSRNPWVDTYIAALATVGFLKCKNAKFRDGFDHAAIFGSGGLFKHVSLMVGPDLWKSKIGEYEDFDHPLRDRALGEYGKFVTYIVRPTPSDRMDMPGEYRL
jgi:hypothetical protein